MKKVFSWIWENSLFLATLFLLAFIPLYPKLPLFDIVNTWVYIRVEDFVILFVLFLWLALLFKKKVTLETPLTFPIIIFWIVGGIATIHGVVLIFPTTANIFPNIAFLGYLRQIEYLSLFFIAYSGMKEKKFLPYVFGVICLTLFLVIIYGFGQRYLGFPAFLTMNEEFAKGTPIKLSSLSRVPSTFAGHYDLAAYLVLVIPILASVFFAVNKWISKILILGLVFLSFILLFMTVSRVSFFVLLISLGLVLLFQKKKFVIFVLPVALIVGLLIFRFSPALLDRFGNTIKKIDVVVDVTTGNPIGHARKVSSSYFQDKTIRRRFFQSTDQLNLTMTEKEEAQVATPSALVPLNSLQPEVVLVEPPNAPTGESLPQGTGYINLSLSPVTKRVGEFFYEKPSGNDSSQSAFMFQGDFLIKRASAYDLSFTTRFQGEWPRAVDAFKRNILVGSGYSSVGLAVDNNYLRLLGETGILGLISFLSIFIGAAIYIIKVFPKIESPFARSFVVGFSAGVVGLMLNALLIDVFDASKIAYVLWILMGVLMATLHIYADKNINLFQEFKKIVTSSLAVTLLLAALAITFYYPMVNNFFVGDDFTWLRWVADCPKLTGETCQSLSKTVFGYFTSADGFFWRPGTKIFFLSMYSFFWLNQTVYHAVSIALHLIVAVLFFWLAGKIFKDSLLAFLASLLFLISTGYSEEIFWISSVGHLFNAVFIILALLLFIKWEETKRKIFLISSIVSIALSLLFYELGVVAPLLIIMYRFVIEGASLNLKKNIKLYLILFLPVFLYLILRFISGSHWQGGDYSYNLLKLPFNLIGNVWGYLMLTIFGLPSLPFYELVRNLLRVNIALSALGIVVGLLLSLLSFRIFNIKSLLRKIEDRDKRIIYFGLLFFLISLLPFLGFGNIASRYSYLASLGLIFLFVFFLKKLYLYLLYSGKEIAILAIGLIVTTFSLFHIVQIQQIYSDWNGAGKKSQNFFISLDSLYSQQWAGKSSKYYFLNVPLKNGGAWIFPWGLRDAVWFAFQNKNLEVEITSNLNYALEQAAKSPSNRVLIFQEDGTLKEIIPPPATY